MSLHSGSEESDDTVGPTTPSPPVFTHDLGKDREAAPEAGLFSLEPSIESGREVERFLPDSLLHPPTALLELAREDKPDLMSGKSDSEEQSEPPALPVTSSGELVNQAETDVKEASSTEAPAIAEFSQSWMIVAEFEREGWDCVLAISNTDRKYWRKGDRFKALSTMEVDAVTSWWDNDQPQPVWIHPDYHAEWEYEDAPEQSSETTDGAGDAEEGDDESVTPGGPNPLPLTGRWHPTWSQNSSVDVFTGHMYLTQLRSEEYWVAQGYYKCQTCKWVVLPNPSIRAIMNSNRVAMATGMLVPELKVTSPDGVVGWLEDLTYYNGETSWADLDSDEEDE